MKINPTDTIAGVSVLTVRDALRKLPQEFELSWFLDAMKPFTHEVSQLVVTELVQSGWVEDRPNNPLRYQITLSGMRLIALRATKRISRATADRVVALIPSRVRTYNADDASIYHIVSVLVFGSYLSDAIDVGDVDIVVTTELLHAPGSPRFRACQQLAPGNDWFRREVWVYNQPIRAIQQSNRLLHVMALSDVAGQPWWESVEKRVLWP